MAHASERKEQKLLSSTYAMDTDGQYITMKIVDYTLELQETCFLATRFPMFNTYTTTLSVSWHA